MTERDPAFLWETEALRTSQGTPAPDQEGVAQPGPGPEEPREGWLTLREASEVTGIPVATLRKWALKGKVPSVLDEATAGARRMVSLEGIQTRARSLGRERSEPDANQKTSSRSSTLEPDTSPPPGTMVVPIDAWDKMLIQLGNLHQAGQQLAEARERAARAETEAKFLRERLAEMRAEDAEAGAAPDRTLSHPAPDDIQNRAASTPARPSFTAYLWRSATSGFRRRR